MVMKMFGPIIIEMKERDVLNESQIDEYKQKLFDAEKKYVAHMGPMGDESEPLISKVLSIMNKELPMMKLREVELFYQLSLRRSWDDDLYIPTELRDIDRMIRHTHNKSPFSPMDPPYSIDDSGENYIYNVPPSSRDLETYLKNLSNLRPPVKISRIGYQYDSKIDERMSLCEKESDVKKIIVNINFESLSDLGLAEIKIHPKYLGFGSITDPILKKLKRGYRHTPVWYVRDKW